ncbi:SDR family oxidoreductase [Glutamicibacter creatinolyticus]|uniref:SDR family oxidoreductase n=1 Tax=Glutamicibacter creatinolyticus TaxID=162496 RepID=A0A5B7WZ71_9MICC|nr:hypothetical protein [Glutamicibacter creatinolyticus]QCY48600.1 SDR family oxidoreductase [Glutamicibacter creatinolyticus]
MTNRMVRSRTAELVAEVLGSRYGRKHLESHGWVPGTPIIMTRSDEPLEDVMALVSLHETPVYVAMLEQEPERLCLLRVTLGTSALEVVNVWGKDETIGCLYEKVVPKLWETFRVRFWRYSAVALRVPELLTTQISTYWRAPSPLAIA